MSDLELDTEPPSEEDAPLLDDDYERPDEPLPTRPRIKAKRWQAKTPGTIVLLAATLKFCITSSGMLMLIPLYRLIEDAVCHAWYEDDGPDIIDEMKCKGDEVQSRLAFLLGWVGLVNAIMSMLRGVAGRLREMALMERSSDRGISLWHSRGPHRPQAHCIHGLWQCRCLIWLCAVHAQRHEKGSAREPVPAHDGLAFPAIWRRRSCVAQHAVRHGCRCE